MFGSTSRIAVAIAVCTLATGCTSGDDGPLGPGPGGSFGGPGGSGGTGMGGGFGAGGAPAQGDAGADPVGAGGMGGGGEGGAGGGGVTRTITWSFPALITDSQRGLVFPTYVAHLLGSKVTHKFPTDLACATVNNPGAMVDATLVIKFPVYGVDTTQNVRFLGGTTSRACVKPTFDFAKLYAIRDATPGRIEVELRVGGNTVSAAMRNISIAPVNEIAWDVPGVPLLEMRDLSAVFVTPKAREVDQLQRQAAEASVFKGFGGGDPYKRSPYKRTSTLETKTHVRELVAVETGEPVSWKVLKVAEGPMAEVEVYLFTVPMYEAWIKGSTTTAAKVWKATEGVEQTATVAAGAYWLVVANQSPDARTIEWTRNANRYDIAQDVLRSIYGALKKLNTRYSNIPGTYFQDWQHVRRADEVLAALSANCIDGSLLFASVLELIGMEPVLIFKTGHAYVGVRSAPGSAVIWPVETTALASADYDRAASVALESMPKDSKSDPLFRNVDIKELRGRGVLPLPQ